MTDKHKATETKPSVKGEGLVQDHLPKGAVPAPGTDAHAKGVKDEPATPVIDVSGSVDEAHPTTVGGVAVKTVPVPAPLPDPAKWVINLALPSSIQFPPEDSPYTTLVITEDTHAARQAYGLEPKDGEKSLPKDAGSVVSKDDKSNYEKMLKGAERATDERRSRYADTDGKKHKKAKRKADDDTLEPIRFLLRHAPAWCSIVEVQCAETVEEARDLVLRFFPACSLDQITEMDSPAFTAAPAKAPPSGGK